MGEFVVGGIRALSERFNLLQFLAAQFVNVLVESQGFFREFMAQQFTERVPR